MHGRDSLTIVSSGGGSSIIHDDIAISDVNATVQHGSTAISRGSTSSAALRGCLPRIGAIEVEAQTHGLKSRRPRVPMPQRRQVASFSGKREDVPYGHPLGSAPE
jgi:hypothetical protein